MIRTRIAAGILALSSLFPAGMYAVQPVYHHHHHHRYARVYHRERHPVRKTVKRVGIGAAGGAVIGGLAGGGTGAAIGALAGGGAGAVYDQHKKHQGR